MHFLFALHQTNKIENCPDCYLYQFPCVTAKGNHMSIFVCLLKGMYDSLLSWPFRHPITFTLIDQAEEAHLRHNITSTFMPNPILANIPFLGRPTSYRNPSLGKGHEAHSWETLCRLAGMFTYV